MEQLERSYWAFRGRLADAQHEAYQDAIARGRRANLDWPARQAKGSQAVDEITEIMAAKWNAELADEPMHIQIEYGM